MLMLRELFVEANLPIADLQILVWENIDVGKGMGWDVGEWEYISTRREGFLRGGCRRSLSERRFIRGDFREVYRGDLSKRFVRKVCRKGLSERFISQKRGIYQRDLS